MTLHGEIKVNHQVIGSWEARRTTSEINDVNLYECEAEMGHGVVRFQVLHRYEAGALALTQRVLLTALQCMEVRDGA